MKIYSQLMSQLCILFTLFLIELSQTSHAAPNTDPDYTDELAKSGVVLKDGKYFCASLGTFIKPHDDKQVSECAFASVVQTRCSTNPNTTWRSGRCFCPELNQYFGENPGAGYFIRRVKLSDPDSQSHVKQIEAQIPTCPKWTPKAHPFGRSVTLKPVDADEGASYLVEFLPGLARDNRDDLLGEQGSAEFPAKIATVLGLPLGFACPSSQTAVIFPNQAHLIANVRAITNDVDFYPVEGELTGQRYLTEFIKGRLPIANIESHGDATFFLHDVDFHLMGLLLLPREIRELAQRQTRYLLDFIEFFKKQHPEEWKLPKFKLMMEKLIEDQISRIDGATGNLTQTLYRLLKEESSADSFFQTISNMDKTKRSNLIASLMAITDGGNGFTERRSVKDFIEDKQYLVFRAFKDTDELSDVIYSSAIRDYTKLKLSDPEFVNEIEIERYQDVYHNNAHKYGGKDAVDLLMARIRELKGKSPGIHMDRKSVL